MNRKFTDMKICTCAKLFQSCPTLCDPMDCSQTARLLCPWDSPGKNTLPCPPPGDLPNPGIKPTSLTSPALAGRFSTTRATREAHENLSTQ